MDEIPLKNYVPHIDLRKWLLRLLIGAFVVWFVGAFAYGVGLLISRSINVNFSERHHALQVRQNDFWEMLAGKRKPTNDLTGVLARQVIQLLHEPAPIHQLETFYARPDDYSGIDNLLGNDIFVGDSSRSDYGSFTDDFMRDAEKSAWNELRYATEPPMRVLTWGNINPWYLFWGSLAYWIVFLVGLGAFVVVTKFHQAILLHRFKANLPQLAKDVLITWRAILADTNLKDRDDLLREAKSLFQRTKDGPEDAGEILLRQLSDLTNLAQVDEETFNP
jgi:hypothetical protein